MSPASPNMPKLLAGGGSYWINAIQLSRSHVTWTGVVAAPGGGIQISSSQVNGGRAISGNVQLSGSCRPTINREPGIAPHATSGSQLVGDE